jgi:hypothetical protein
MSDPEMYARLRIAMERIDAATNGREWLAGRHIRRVMDAMAQKFFDSTGGDLRWQATTIPSPAETFGDKTASQDYAPWSETITPTGETT